MIQHRFSALVPKAMSGTFGVLLWYISLGALTRTFEISVDAWKRKIRTIHQATKQNVSVSW